MGHGPRLPVLGKAVQPLKLAPRQPPGGVEAAQRQRRPGLLVDRQRPRHHQRQRIAEARLTEQGVETRTLAGCRHRPGWLHPPEPRRSRQSGGHDGAPVFKCVETRQRGRAQPRIVEQVAPRRAGVQAGAGQLVPPAEPFRRFPLQQQEPQLARVGLSGELVKPAAELAMGLSGVVDDHQRRPLGDKGPRRQGLDHRAQFRRRDEAGDPATALRRRDAPGGVDAAAELDREPGLAGTGAADQRPHRKVGLLREPSLEIGQHLRPADDRHGGPRRVEDVELAPLTGRECPAPFRRRDLQPPEWQPHAAVAEDQRRCIPVTGDHDAPADIMPVKRTVHPLRSDQDS
ncbi:hypothetical protein H5395_14385 [Paracoccus sp. MC1854]|uniref:hypothetical protein n=1 Tax=Paracoccus sp. MC1854 TaxID=2760306 RepID=UPI0016014B61|nr:hypothetical protein [Paracoccus sp. MC1854]MBB1492697.1 hypothetical protein [Paracoccus sp. MC1854]